MWDLLFDVILPRDAYATHMHSAVYALAQCSVLLPSVTNWCFVKIAERIEVMSQQKIPSAYLIFYIFKNNLL